MYEDKRMKRFTAILAVSLLLTSVGFAASKPHPALAKLLAAKDIDVLDAERVPEVKPPGKIVHDYKPYRIKVLVLDFNPYIPGSIHSPDDPDAEPKGIRELGGWNDPVPLAAGYMQDFCDISQGLIQYDIVAWLTVRRFQKKADGYTYTPEAYMRGLRAGTGKADAWHRPDGVDYPNVAKEFNLIPLVEDGVIDEVWMMGAPYFGYWESCMLGRDAYYINGGVYGYDQVPSERRFVIMGFNYERGVAEMLHDVTHRMEATMSRIYGGWKSDELNTNWARFAANQKQSGTAAVGTCHYPPNAEHDYDYANERFVDSTAPDWLHYPDLAGRSERINREAWAGPHKHRGNPDYHRNFQRWWYEHLPIAPGWNEDGRLNNWWEYLYNYNAYDDRGKPLKNVRPVKDPHAAREGYRRPA